MRRSEARQSSQPCCSFCHKGQETVAKLISTPSDYPRAYICDECIAVCASILGDEPPLHATGPTEMALQHRRINELMDALGVWVDDETRGADSQESLAEVRRLAMLIFSYEPDV